MGKPFLFRCPATGTYLQERSHAHKQPAEGESNYYEGVQCRSCGALHIVNPETGRLMSEEND